MIRKKSKEELLTQMLRGIVQETDITMIGKGSVTRGLASVFSGSIEQLYQSLHDAIVNSALSTATGFYLDLIGETYGLSRRYATAASVSASERVIKFYVSNGTLASRLPHPTNLNLGRIPAGTQISTASGIIFVVDANYDFPAASKEAYVGASTTATGASQSVGANQITTHNLGLDVLVSNVSPINTGTDVESDDDYRFRIARWVRTSAGKNEMAVRVAVLSAPGVADLIKEPYFAGAGSFRIIVIPSGNKVPADTIRQISSNLNSVVSEGTFFIIEQPRYIPVAISIRLIPGQGKTISPVDRDLAEQAVLRYIGNIRPGQSLIINQIRSIVIGASNNIGDLRIQGLSINRRPQALVNYKLRNDELFIPDEESEDPISVI